MLSMKLNRYRKYSSIYILYHAYNAQQVSMMSRSYIYNTHKTSNVSIRKQYFYIAQVNSLIAFMLNSY